jgi:spermidine synthase
MVSFAEDKDLAILFRGLDLIEALTSDRQEIELFSHPLLGKILVIDKEVQHVENWQPLYHEPLIHLPAAFVREVNNVLILGGGSLFAAAEALRYPSVKQCVLVDHDVSVLDLMSRHYGHVGGVLNDRRFEHIAQDAIKYLQESDHKFDLVVNDCFDSIALTRTRGLSAFQLMTRRLTAGGVCSDLVYRHVFESGYSRETRNALREMPSYGLSLVNVPDYPGTLHVLTFWGGASISQDIRLPRNEIQKSWCEQNAPNDLKFFNPAFLSFHLYIPPYLKRTWMELPDEGSAETKFT